MPDEAVVVDANGATISPELIRFAIAAIMSNGSGISYVDRVHGNLLDTVKASFQQSQLWKHCGIILTQIPDADLGDCTIATTLGGIPLEIDMYVPEDSIEFYAKDRIVGKIKNLGVPQCLMKQS